MSTSDPVEDKADNALADDEDAATVAADERNDNEAARDAAATALWTRCLEHAGTSPRDQKIPTHVAVLKDIHGADYSTLLKCPLDDRSEHPYGQKGERKLAATGALARCRIEFFASDYTGLFRQGTRTGLIRFSTAVRRGVRRLRGGVEPTTARHRRDAPATPSPRDEYATRRWRHRRAPRLWCWARPSTRSCFL